RPKRTAPRGIGPRVVWLLLLRLRRRLPLHVLLLLPRTSLLPVLSMIRWEAEERRDVEQMLDIEAAATTSIATTMLEGARVTRIRHRLITAGGRA
ncbi:unnamed protein product, partial [Ectocarpus sp. 8 AP-2014]